jgi:hypothetical protein
VKLNRSHLRAASATVLLGLVLARCSDQSSNTCTCHSSADCSSEYSCVAGICCGTLGQGCSTSADCCSGNCWITPAPLPNLCRSPACTSSADCADGGLPCVGGFCGEPNGAACQQAGQCQGGGCVDAGCCGILGTVCASPSDCCAGVPAPRTSAVTPPSGAGALEPRHLIARRPRRSTSPGVQVRAAVAGRRPLLGANRTAASVTRPRQDLI